MRSDTSVSIIIPALNSPVINQTLDSLLGQTYADQIAEIWVVGLDEPGLIQKREPIHFISTGKPVNAAIARNIGIQHAQSNWLIFVDSDCVATCNWLPNLIGCLASNKPVVAGSVSLKTQNYLSLCYNLALFSDTLALSPSGYRLSVPSLNLAATRQVIDHVGLFNEDLPRSHDVELSCRIRRAGYEIYFCPDAEMIHLPDLPNMSIMWRKFFTSGFYSAGVRTTYSDMLNTPWFFNHSLILASLSPILSIAAILKTFSQSLNMLRYIHAIPTVYMCKIAWCWGASRQAAVKSR